MSNKAVKFIIELDYDLASLRFMTGKEITQEQFVEEAEEQAVYDLMDLMRSNSISDVSGVKEYELD